MILPEQEAVAAYWSPREYLVIRQKSNMGEDDQVIVIQKLNVRAFADKLHAIIKEEI